MILIVTNGESTSFATLAREIQAEFRDLEIEILPHDKVRDCTVCDVLLALWWRPVAGGLMTRVRVRQSVILCVYDHYSWTHSQMQRDLMSQALGEAGYLVVANEQLLQELRTAYGSIPPAWVCRTGIDCDRFKVAPFPETFTALWCGNSLASKEEVDLKGVRMIEEACERAGVPLMAADTVRERGERIDYDRMPQWYAQGSIYLVASESEGTPRTMLEALACGRPVCTTRVGIVADAIHHGVNGVIVDRNRNALVSGIRYLRNLVQSFPGLVGRSARAAALANSLSVRMPQWRSVLDTALSGKWWKGGEQRSNAPLVEEQVSIPGDIMSMEVQELLGQRFPDSALQALVDELDPCTDRPKILVTSPLRFVSRTLRIIRHLVNDFRFIVRNDVYPADIVWSLYPFGDGQIAARVRREFGVPYVQTLRGAFWNLAQDMTRQAVNSVGNADAIVPLTHNLANAIADRWPAMSTIPTTVIHNGGYVEEIGSRQLFAAERFRRPIVLCSTNFKIAEKRRAVDELVRALERRPFTGTFVITAQEGRSKPRSSHMGRRTHYLGFVRDRFAWMRTADLFFYHSYQDGQPTTLMEAMSAGLPCVVVTCPESGASEFIEHEKTGYLARDAESGADIVMRLLENPQPARAAGAAARDAMRTKYTWEAAAMAYRNLFRSLIDSGR
jgi:glycosyltransferase involved in cell wall biosynthesis